MTDSSEVLRILKEFSESDAPKILKGDELKLFNYIKASCVLLLDDIDRILETPELVDKLSDINRAAIVRRRLVYGE